MRILHCGKFYPPHRGGMETFLDQLAQTQAASGDEVLVLAHASGPTQALTGNAVDTFQPALRLRVQRAPVLFTLGGYAPVAPTFPLLFLQALRRFRPHVIHVHAPNGAALWPALLGGRTPLVLHWHADVQFPAHKQPSPLLRACWQRLETIVLRRSKAIIVTSQAYLDSSLPLAAHRDKCHVVPLGLAECTMAEAAAPTRAEHPALDFLDAAPGLRVLAVGRLSHYKGFRYLCQALQQMPEASLCLVGEGEERADLEALAATPEAKGRIFLAGEVPDQVLDACYRRSQVLCLPSLTRSEAFGMVLLEAMSRGLPCLVTRVPGSGMTEVVRHGETGLLVSPGAPGELAQALRQLADDPALRHRLGQAGRQRFATHYTMPAVAQSISAIYKDVLTKDSIS